MYIRATHKKFDINDIRSTASCPECQSKHLMLSRGRLSCRNCGAEIGRIGKTNKYGAKRTEINGKKYDKAKVEEAIKDLGPIE